MAGTGEQRRKDKHAGKKAAAEKKAQAFLDAVDGKSGPAERPQLSPEEKAKLAKDYLKATPGALSKAEMGWYLAIMSLVLDGQEPNPEKAVVTACQMAKALVMQEKCEEALEQEGYFLTSDKGLIYSHPASRMLINLHNVLNRCSSLLGLKSVPRSTIKPPEEPKAEEAESPFGQFQLPINP